MTGYSLITCTVCKSIEVMEHATLVWTLQGTVCHPICGSIRHPICRSIRHSSCLPASFSSSTTLGSSMHLSSTCNPRVLLRFMGVFVEKEADLGRSRSSLPPSPSPEFLRNRLSHHKAYFSKCSFGCNRGALQVCESDTTFQSNEGIPSDLIGWVEGGSVRLADSILFYALCRLVSSWKRYCAFEQGRAYSFPSYKCLDALGPCLENKGQLSNEGRFRTANRTRELLIHRHLLDVVEPNFFALDARD